MSPVLLVLGHAGFAETGEKSHLRQLAGFARTEQPALLEIGNAGVAPIAAAGLSAAALGQLSAWLPRGRVDRKQAGAHAMLGAIRAHLDAGVAPLRISYRMAETAAWQAAVRQVA